MRWGKFQISGISSLRSARSALEMSDPIVLRAYCCSWLDEPGQKAAFSAVNSRYAARVARDSPQRRFTAEIAEIAEKTKNKTGLSPFFFHGLASPRSLR
jgi:hypothetical protein